MICLSKTMEPNSRKDNSRNIQKNLKQIQSGHRSLHCRLSWSRCLWWTFHMATGSWWPWQHLLLDGLGTAFSSMHGTRRSTERPIWIHLWHWVQVSRLYSVLLTRSFHNFGTNMVSIHRSISRHRPLWSPLSFWANFWKRGRNPILRLRLKNWSGCNPLSWMWSGKMGKS